MENEKGAKKPSLRNHLIVIGILSAFCFIIGLGSYGRGILFAMEIWAIGTIAISLPVIGKYFFEMYEYKQVEKLKNESQEERELREKFKRLKGTDPIWGTLGVIVLFCFGVYYLYVGVDYGFLHSEISAYPIVCEKRADDTKETCLEWKALELITYKVNVAEQFVIDDSLNRLKNCVVRSRTNWRCDVDLRSFGTSPVGFIDGKYFSESWPTYVSKWKWSQTKKVEPTNSSENFNYDDWVQKSFPTK